MTDAELVVTIPYKPRPQQRAFAKRFRRARFGVLLCHRRLGKTVLAVNLLQQGALSCALERPRFSLIGPTYRQAKLTAWDYLQFYAKPIPGVKVNQSELRVDYPNGAQVRLFGADNPDSLRGIYNDGVVMDEFGLFPPNAYSEVIAPTLVDRGGWALFCGTPAGKNAFYDMAVHAKAQEAAGDPLWIYGEYRASQTGLLDPTYLASARQIMTADEYEQEFECSFEASIKGAIFGKELSDAREQGRIVAVPYDACLPVHTAWDLGVGDASAIWFWQVLRGGEVRVIDYLEASGEGLPYYVRELQRKPYVYGKHWAPPDIRVRELGSGKSRLETAQSLGLRFEVVPDIGLEDGIAAARLLLGKCWIDQGKCAKGLEALMHYRRDWNSRLNEFKAAPVHDWSSHAADGFRYLAIAYKPPVEKRPTHRPSFTGQPTSGTNWMT